MTKTREIPPLTEAQAKLFADKVQRGDGCWQWRGAPDHNGYGVFCIERAAYRAHRVAVTLDGRSIPNGMVIDHACRNRLCVNPAHLRVVSHRVNVHENSEAPGHLNSLKTHCAHGHPYSGENLIIRPSGRRACRECSRIANRKSRATKAGSSSKNNHQAD